MSSINVSVATSRRRGGGLGFALFLLLALLLLFLSIPVIHNAFSVQIRNSFRLQLIAYGVPEAIADDWAWGGHQTTYTIHVSAGSLPQTVGARQLGGLRIFPGDLGPVTQILKGQHFGPYTPLGTGASDFFVMAAPYAQELHQLTGIPTSTILAQWADETNYGQSLYGWNFGNQKDPSDPSGNTYMVFTSADAGVRGEAQLLFSNPAYANLVAQRDPAAAAGAWGQSPWAESHYVTSGPATSCSTVAPGCPGSLLLSLINTYSLGQYDTQPIQLAASPDIIHPLPTLPQTAPDILKLRLNWIETDPNINAQYPNGNCEQFAEQFYGNNWHYPSAAAAESGPNFHAGSITSAPIGSLIYFEPNEDNAGPGCPQGCGHVGIRLDADTMLATSPLGVQPISISFWSNHYAPVVGWRDPFVK